MVGKQINIDPKEKTVDIFVDDITTDELKGVLNHFKGMDDYEFIIHNPQQTTCLIDVYENDEILHLGNKLKEKEFKYFVLHKTMGFAIYFIDNDKSTWNY